MSLGEPSRVRILFDDGVCEEVAVSFVGECLCRLEQTPLASASEARLGDVVEFEPEDGIAKMRRIAERSPYTTLTWIVSDVVAASDAFGRLAARIVSEGGRVERAFGGTILAHVRPDTVEGVDAAFSKLMSGRG
jgi:hypothetical protein